ncbi:MAG: hypothetical protein OEM16_18720, partial [Myxococcales bacterium]|nr:hypothetical protein [Myxococcales bacterium]
MPPLEARGRSFAVLCMTLLIAACGSSPNSAPGNTELNVVIPTGGGSTAPAAFDIQVVEYTINCDATPPTAAD